MKTWTDQIEGLKRCIAILSEDKYCQCRRRLQKELEKIDYFVIDEYVLENGESREVE